MTEIQSIFVSSFIRYQQNFDQSSLFKKKNLTNTRQKSYKDLVTHQMPKFTISNMIAATSIQVEVICIRGKNRKNMNSTLLCI